MTVTTLAPRARHRMQPPPPADPVTQYALDVVAGRIVAGLLVRKACERHLSDLATGAQRGLSFDVKAADRAIGFFPLLRHYKGEWAGKPINLEPWERFVIGSAFGWKRADGTRRFRQVYLEVAKKNGKTILAAGIGLLLAFFDDEPGAEVYSIATKRDQAKLVWNDAKRMVEKNAWLARRVHTFALSIADESSASFFRPLGRDSGDAEQGINAHGGIIDELHVIDDPDSIDNVETAMASRRQPMIVKITTAGKKRASVWADERADAVAVVEGRATDDSMLVLVYTLDDTREEFYGSSTALRWMIQSCTCHQRDTGSTPSHAASILTDHRSASGSAIRATDAVFEQPTPTTTDAMPDARRNGRTPTARSGAPLADAGRCATPDGRSNGTDSFDSGSPPTSTTGGSPNKTPDARSAANGPTNSASTTTTPQEWLEGSSAGSATGRSGSSGTLSSAYHAHLPTCAVRSSSRPQDDGLRVTIPGDDPFDEAVWPKSNPNLGVSVSIDFLREQAAKARRSPGKLAGFLQLRMNVPTQQSVKAIDIDEWDACSGRPDDEEYEDWVARVIPEGSVGYGGLDLASVKDLTAKVDVFRDDEGYVNVLCRFWCPEDGIRERSRIDGVPYEDWARDGWLIATPGNVTDYAFVREATKTDAAVREIREIGFDRWNATQLTTELAQDGATCIAIPQTHTGLAAAWRELERLILDHKLRHGGHPILRWMAGNVEVETDAAGNQKPSKAKSSERIDGIAALTMAIARLIVHGDEQTVAPMAVWA